MLLPSRRTTTAPRDTARSLDPELLCCHASALLGSSTSTGRNTSFHSSANVQHLPIAPYLSIALVSVSVNYTKDCSD